MGQTAVYGLPSIVGRLVSFLLTPLLTGILDTSSFGIMTNLFVYIAFFLALLTWGMETAVFHFSNRFSENDKVFSTAFLFNSFLGLLFLTVSLLFAAPLAVWLKYPGHGEYIVYMALIIAFDVLTAIPMAKLRHTSQPIRFSLINLAGILLNISLVIFFLVYCKNIYRASHGNPPLWLEWIYNDNIGVGYVFVANIASSAFKFLLAFPVLKLRSMEYDRELLRQMLAYSTPLAVASICFIINEKADTVIMKFLLPEKEADATVGIYGAVYKLAIIMNIFIQAFRFAAEPFFFSMRSEGDARMVYARVLNYFTGLCLLIFLLVSLFINQFKYFLQNPDYWAGLGIVPVLLLANLFSGIYQNLSMWYKLSGKTFFGMLFSILGAAITIGLNLLFIPLFGYVGSAWATLICYLSMCLISYAAGQKNYPIPYQPFKVLFYIVTALLIFWTHQFIPKYSLAGEFFAGIAGLIIFSVLFIRSEKDLKNALLKWISLKR